jgi:hypothetical protein
VKPKTKNLLTVDIIELNKTHAVKVECKARQIEDLMLLAISLNKLLDEIKGHIEEHHRRMIEKQRAPMSDELVELFDKIEVKINKSTKAEAAQLKKDLIGTLKRISEGG